MASNTSTSSQTSTAASPTIQDIDVSVSVIFDDAYNRYELSLSVDGADPGDGSQPGDLVLTPGAYDVRFTLVESPSSRFALGPVLTGPSQPGPTATNPVEFRITQIRTDAVNMSFVLDADSGNCEYAIRVLAPDGTTIVKDPKVINRGFPPLPETPPLIP